MTDDFALEAIKTQFAVSAQQLLACNRVTEKFGLILSEEQIQGLVTRRFEALKDTGRIEFGEGVLKKLVLAFCDSPYITQENYADAIAELQDSFYYFKNESHDLISDDELIEFMTRMFNEKAHGSLEYLSGTSLEDLCRNTCYGYEDGEQDENGLLF